MCCPHKAHSQGSLCFPRPKAIGRKQWHWECPSPPYKVSYAQGGWTLWWMRFCCSHSLILLVFSSPELYPSAFQPRGLLFTPLYLPHPLCFTSPAVPQCLTPSFLLPKFLVLSCVYLIKHHHVTFWITWPDHVCSYGQLPPQTAVPVFCSLNFENIVYLYIQKRPNLGKFSDNYLVDSLGTRRAFKTVILYCQNSDTLSWHFLGFLYSFHWNTVLQPLQACWARDLLTWMYRRKTHGVLHFICTAHLKELLFLGVMFLFFSVQKKKGIYG